MLKIGHQAYRKTQQKQRKAAQFLRPFYPALAWIVAAAWRLFRGSISALKTVRLKTPEFPYAGPAT
jgi:hypothetical protein